MLHPATITTTVLDKILIFLTPLFMDPETTDTSAARNAANAILASYGARTNRELRLAALSIAFAFGALDALSRATDPELALNHVLRLRGNANALNRAAHQNETRLEKLRNQPLATPGSQAATQETADAPADTLPITTATNDLLAFARADRKVSISAATPVAPAATVAMPLSRQQRRAAERKAEKLRQRQQEATRRAQRLTGAREIARQSP